MKFRLVCKGAGSFQYPAPKALCREEDRLAQMVGYS